MSRRDAIVAIGSFAALLALGALVVFVPPFATRKPRYKSFYDRYLEDNTVLEREIIEGFPAELFEGRALVRLRQDPDPGRFAALLKTGRVAAIVFERDAPHNAL